MEFDFINTANAERTGDVLAVNTPAPTDLWVTFKELPCRRQPAGRQHEAADQLRAPDEQPVPELPRTVARVRRLRREPEQRVRDRASWRSTPRFDERATWALGVFKNTRNIFGWNIGDGEYDITGRVTCLPVWENDGEYLVHLGLGASHRDLDDDQERLRARLMFRNGPAVLHTIVTEVRAFGDSRTRSCPEFVAVAGPWTFAAEYYAIWMTDATTPTIAAGRTANEPRHGLLQGRLCRGAVLPDRRAPGLRPQAGGVHPRHAEEQLHRLRDREPGTNARGARRRGRRVRHRGLAGRPALQLASTWTTRASAAARAQDVTLGLNWFLNPYMKWQWNYTALYRDAPVDAATAGSTGSGRGSRSTSNRGWWRSTDHFSRPDAADPGVRPATRINPNKPGYFRTGGLDFSTTLPGRTRLSGRESRRILLQAQILAAAGYRPGPGPRSSGRGPSGSSGTRSRRGCSSSRPASSPSGPGPARCRRAAGPRSAARRAGSRTAACASSVVHAEHREDARLHVRAVDTDAAAADLVAVDHQVVRLRPHLARVGSRGSAGPRPAAP